jgi:hypothetical protein
MQKFSLYLIGVGVKYWDKSIIVMERERYWKMLEHIFSQY